MNEVATVATVNDAIFMTENIWIMISAMLVFIMGLGFACVEAGLVRAKCSANVAFKNIAVPAIGITMYALLGFGLMYPGTFNGILGFAGFGIGESDREILGKEDFSRGIVGFQCPDVVRKHCFQVCSPHDFRASGC